MLDFTVPAEPPQSPPALIERTSGPNKPPPQAMPCAKPSAAVAAQAAGAKNNANLAPLNVPSPSEGRVAGVCTPINYRPSDIAPGSYWPESEGGVSPQDFAVYYLQDFLKKKNVPRPSLDAVEVLVPPTHGQVRRGTNAAAGDPRYNYVPDVDFIGEDRIVFRVHTAEGPVTVRYYLKVTDKGGDRVPWQRFCKERFWKISSTANPDSVKGARLTFLEFERFSPRWRTGHFTAIAPRLTARPCPNDSSLAPFAATPCPRASLSAPIAG